jgi:hypothetical protein
MTERIDIGSKPEELSSDIEQSEQVVDSDAQNLELTAPEQNSQYFEKLANEYEEDALHHQRWIEYTRRRMKAELYALEQRFERGIAKAEYDRDRAWQKNAEMMDKFRELREAEIQADMPDEMRD